MSRVMTSVAGALTSNAIVTYLTCPAGHKYEVIVIGFGSAGTVLCTYQVLLQDAAAQRFVDECAIAAAGRGLARNYNGLVMVAGDKLNMRPLHAGSLATTYVVTYIDVTL